jgi:heat shock protein HspQ
MFVPRWESMTPFEPFERSRAMTGKIDIPLARFAIGDVVRHRLFDFRGVVFDVDPEFANSDAWYEAIPEAIRPSKDQPYYHLLAENAESAYIAYVSQQNLARDDSDEPVEHPAIATMFDRLEDGRYQLRAEHRQ